MNEANAQKLTHAARSERRRLMAEAVKGGNSAPSVARMFSVSLRTVYDACAEFEVKPGSAESTRILQPQTSMSA